jgi:hypothetical protein
VVYYINYAALFLFAVQFHYDHIRHIDSCFVRLKQHANEMAVGLMFKFVDITPDLGVTSRQELRRTGTAKTFNMPWVTDGGAEWNTSNSNQRTPRIVQQQTAGSKHQTPLHKVGKLLMPRLSERILQSQVIGQMPNIRIVNRCRQ